MLSKAARVCVASLCLATSTEVEAFLAPSVALRGATPARGYQRQRGTSCARCNTSPVQSSSRGTVATTMTGGLDDDNIRRTRLVALRNRLFWRNRGSGAEPGEGEGDVYSAAAPAEDEVSMRRRVQGRARELMRRSFVGLATAVIVRSSFNPQPSSAVGLYRPGMGGGTTSSRQLEKKQQKEAERRERIRKEVEREQQERLDAATSDLNGEISEKQAAEAAAAATGDLGDEVSSAGATGEQSTIEAGAEKTVVPLISDELVAKICALPSPAAQEHALKKLVPDDYRKVWNALTTAQQTALVKLRIENKTFQAVSIGDARKRGSRDMVPLGFTFSAFILFTGMRTSLRVMANQRKRVKAEAAKFDMERDEFMNVDGEAEFDVDIMKELRDMKEKMAGPGDTYAKDTRAYNPEFAAAAGDEDEYDKKIQEALKGTGKGFKTTKGETRKVFTNKPNVDPSKGTKGKGASVASAPGTAEDLLGDGGGDGVARKSRGEADAGNQTAKMKADAKRLENLFNKPSIDDPEDDDDLGAKRELLP